MRYRVDLPISAAGIRPVRPDIVFTKQRICCFIDGCWWHGCPEHGRRRTSSNGEYWNAKIARNMERDAEQQDALERAGWTVVRFWEHEDPDHVTAVIAAAVEAARSSSAVMAAD
jgi:DNA mismatch endonuclease (patch repair protein)